MDLGNRKLGVTLRFAFFTAAADGTPTTLSGTPGLSVYKDASTTQTTAGVSLLTNFDSLAGLNNVSIDTSADAFYVAGSDYMVVITTGTVDGVSVVGSVVATFSIENRHEPLEDAGSLPGQEAPSATATPLTMLAYLFKSWRNKKDNNGSETKLYADDATTVDQKQSTSESAGTVTKGEWATGP